MKIDLPPVRCFDEALRGDLGSDLFGRLAMPKGDVDWSLHIDPSPHKANDTPLIARRLAADQLPRRALAGSLTTNRRYPPSYRFQPSPLLPQATARKIWSDSAFW